MRNANEPHGARDLGKGEGDLAPLSFQEAQDHSHSNYDVSLSRTLNIQMRWHDRVEQKSHSHKKSVHSGQPLVFDNKQSVLGLPYACQHSSYRRLPSHEKRQSTLGFMYGAAAHD